jgi:hypothetical protein
LDYIDGDDYNWLYGSWLWWRFLTEYFGGPAGPDPSVVRQVWERIGWGQGSLQAQRNVMDLRRSTFRTAFAEFGAANRIVGRWYDEGQSYARFRARAAGRFTITKHRQGIDWKATKIDHLSTKHAVIRPGNDLRGRWRLVVQLDLPPKFRGSVARALVHRKDGRVGWVRVRLNRRGDVRFSVPFSRRKVSHVTLSLTNASTRMGQCRSGTRWSCGGRPLDDGLPFQFRARAVR